MENKTPMATLVRDAFLTSSSNESHKPISELAAYLELLVGSPLNVEMISLKAESRNSKWRTLVITESVVVEGSFGYKEDELGRFFADLRIESLDSVKRFKVGPSSTAVRETDGHVSGISPEIVVTFGDWGALSIGGDEGYAWGFPVGVQNADAARDQVIRLLRQKYLAAR